MEGGGAERVAALLCNRWAREGHHVTIVPTFSGRGGCSYPLDAGVHVDYLADRVGVRSKNKATANRFRRFFALRRVVRMARADVVVSFLAQVNIVTLLATRGLPIPVVVSERVFPPRVPMPLFWRLLRRLTYRWADRVVAQTRGTAQWVTSQCPGSRVTIIPNPVVFPLPAGSPVLKPNAYLASERRLVLAVGRLDQQKGFDILLVAFRTIADRMTEWDLVILGEGPERNALEMQVRKLGLMGRVHLPGWAGNLSDWYRRAELYALSSRFEGFPNTLLEAMVHGLPAVSFDCETGPRDIVRDEVDGLLVPLNAGADGFATTLERIMTDDALRTQMACSAQTVRKRYSMENIEPLWSAALGLGA